MGNLWGKASILVQKKKDDFRKHQKIMPFNELSPTASCFKRKWNNTPTSDWSRFRTMKNSLSFDGCFFAIFVVVIWVSPTSIVCIFLRLTTTTAREKAASAAAHDLELWSAPKLVGSVVSVVSGDGSPLSKNNMVICFSKKHTKT